MVSTGTVTLRHTPDVLHWRSHSNPRYLDPGHPGATRDGHKRSNMWCTANSVSEKRSVSSEWLGMWGIVLRTLLGGALVDCMRLVISINPHDRNSHLHPYHVND